MNDYSIAVNATASMGSLASVFPTIGILISVAVIFAIIMGTVFAIPFISKRMRQIFGMFGVVIVYFFKGLGLCAAGAAMYFGAQWLGTAAQSDPEAMLETVKWIGIGIGGFIGISVVGFIGTKVWNVAKSRVKKTARNVR